MRHGFGGSLDLNFLPNLKEFIQGFGSVDHMPAALDTRLAGN
jgi:hypothetical protein